MKVKGFISAFLALAVSAGLGITAMADGANVSSTNDEGIVVTADADMKIKTVVADFDVNGRLVSAFTKLVDTVKGDNTYTYADLGVSGIGAQRKVMLWKEESIEPISMPGEALTDMNGYLTACVDAVEADADKFYIWFDSSSREDAELVINKEHICNVTLNGETISYEEIKAGDVLTIKCAEGEWLEDMDSYEIIVSRNTADGVIAMYDTEAEVCTLEDGRSYVDMDLIPGRLELGTNYRLYLDIFGRIVYAEEIVDYGNIGIIEEVYSTEGVYSADIIDTEGIKINYIVTEEDYEALKECLYYIALKDDVTGRVISYRISDDGVFTLNQVFEHITGTVVDYNSETSVGINNAKELMLHDYDTATPITKADLENGQQYKAWYYGKDIDGIHQLVLLYKVEKVSLDSPMAICVAEVSESKGKYTISAYSDGKQSTFTVENEAVAQALKVGDAFFYTKNDDGVITGVTPILKNSMSTYADLYNAAIENKLDLVNSDVLENLPEKNEVVFGIITEFFDSTSDEMEIATSATVKDMAEVDVYSDTEAYDISDAVVVYLYDYDEEERLSKGGTNTLFPKNFPNSAYVDDDVVDFTKSLFLSEGNPDYGRVKLALLRIVDDEVIEAYIIDPSNTR